VDERVGNGAILVNIILVVERVLPKTNKDVEVGPISREILLHCAF
jgi:hypothetical protein